jgi:hypothetical protein
MTVAEASAFLSAALEREGAAVEAFDDGALVLAVLPPALQSALGLPESVSVRVSGPAAASEITAAYESALMQRLIERVNERGRAAACTLPSIRPPSRGVAERVLAQVQSLNASVRLAGTRPIEFQALALEFQYAAMAEDRAEGFIEVATDASFRSVSPNLGRTLLGRLPDCVPIALRLAPSDLAGAIARVDGVVRAAITERLGPFRSRLAARLARDARRLLDYHDTLLSEARRRFRGADSGESKAAAILRARDEKLRELVSRYSVSVRYAPLSVLAVSYPSCACDLVIRRRHREIPLPVAWDPVHHAPLPVSCPACALPALAFHACDDAGHLTCAACATPCPHCSRVSCRSCHPAGCPKCPVSDRAATPPP